MDFKVVCGIMNAGFSLGTYGLEATLYARLLTARWAELSGQTTFSRV